jgi:hypothetical protein
MPARALLDVDLEDKLIYGLTPIRLGYLVLSLLAAFALWSSPWSPDAVRAVVCATVVALGAMMAWGRWRARPTDQWLIDIALFLSRRYRIDWCLDLRSRHPKAAPSSG